MKEREVQDLYIYIKLPMN